MPSCRNKPRISNTGDSDDSSESSDDRDNSTQHHMSSSPDDSDCSDIEDGDISEWESDWETEEEDENVTRQESLQNPGSSKPSTSASGESCRMSQVADANNIDSDDSETECIKCPICLASFVRQEVATPQSCEHYFCAKCLMEWAKHVNTCPVDRIKFNLILLRDAINGPIKQEIYCEPINKLSDSDEGPTYCLVCHQCDREHSLLLCDLCNEGYHLECLTPPLLLVPEGQWFCPRCSSLQVADGPNEVSQGRRNQRNPVGSRRRRQTRRQQRVGTTSVASVSVSNTLQSESRRRKRKKRKRRKKSKKVKNILVPVPTRRGRLAEKLGIGAQKNHGILPANINRQRNHAGIPTLHIFGRPDNLEYFSSGSEGEERSDEVGGLSVMVQPRPINSISARRLAAMKTILRSDSSSVSRRRRPVAVSSHNEDTNADILGSIMESQSLWHSKNSVVTINRDGSVDIRKKSDRSSTSSGMGSSHSDSHSPTLLRPDSRLREVMGLGAPVNVNSPTSSSVSTVPLYPGGGNNSVPSSSGSQTSGTTQFNTSQSYQNNPGYSRTTGTSYDATRANREYSNYLNNESSSSSTVGSNPVRFRLMQKMPIKRSQPPKNSENTSEGREEEQLSSVDEPLHSEPNLEIKDEISRTKNSKDTEEEDLDIYSDIEVDAGSGGNGASEHDEVERTYDTLLPPPEPSALLMGLGEQESSDGDTSDSLVIDFTPPRDRNVSPLKTDAARKSPISESDKYDPAVPSVDTEDEQSSLEIALNTSAEEEIPLPSCPPSENSNLADKNIAGNYLHSPTYDDISKRCTANEGVLNQVVFQNQLASISSSMTKSIVPTSQNYVPDDEDDDEGECPNFSIYSATSMDIARETAEEQEGNEESVKISDDDEGKTTHIHIDETSGNKCIRKENNEKHGVDMLSDKPEVQSAEFDCSVESISTCDDQRKNFVESGFKQKECEKGLDKDTDFYQKSRKFSEHTKISETDMKSDSGLVQDENRNSATEFKLTRDEEDHCPKSKKLSSSTNDSNVEDNGDSGRKANLVEEIFGSDDNDSLIGGATSAVSAATLDNNLPSSTPLGLEGLDTETISETEEAINFDDLSQDGTEFLTEEDGEICSTKKRKKRIVKGSVSLGKDMENLAEIDGFAPPDSIDYEEGEIVDDRPKLSEQTKKDKRSDKKDKRHEKETLKISDENLDVTKTKALNDEEKRKKKKKSLDKERTVLESSENKDKSKDKVSKLEETSISWKKLSKGTKDRSYRDGKLSKANEKEKESSKKGAESKDVAAKKEKKKKEKRKDMERYDVRKIVSDKKRKRRDEFGRDLSRDRSYSKSRSRSRGRSRDRSRSVSRGKLNRSKARSPLRSRLRSRSRSYRSRSRSKNRTKRKSKERGRKSRSRDRMRKLSRDRSRSRAKRSRSRSRSRSRNRSRSRSLQRSRERKDRVRTTARSSQRNPSRRSWSNSWTPSWSRSRSISCSSYSRSCTPSARHFNRSYSPSFSRSWSREHNERLPVVEKKGVPLVKATKKLTVIVNNTKEDGDRLKKKDKKKKEQKKLKGGITILEKRKKRKEKSPAPSKEVFTSGDNILVSVNFNKSNKSSKDATIPAVTATVPTFTRETTKRKREEGLDIERDQSKKIRKDKVVKEKSQGAKSNNTANEKLSKLEKKSKKAKEDKRIAALLKQKPVAIIDLDQSPFREQTPSPTDLIVLSDSDEEIRNKENENTVDILTGRRLMRPSSNSPQSSSKLSHMMPKISSSRTPESESPLHSAISNYLVTSTGPKTPPEPQIKFSVATKPQLRSISNPLREDDDDMLAEDNCLDDSDQRIEEELNRNISDIIHKGPNTPPEPRGPTTPRSPPTSPDAYDPFDPTKSGTPSPVRQEISLDGMESPNGTPCEEIHQHNIGSRNSPMASDSEDLLKSVEMSSKNPLLQSCEDITEVSDFPHSPDHSCLSRVDSTLGKSPSGLAESTVTSSQLQHDIELSPSIETSEILEKGKHKPVTSSGTLLVTSSSDISKLSPDRKMMTIASQQSKLQMNSQKQHIKSIPTSQQPVTSTPTCQILYSNVSNLAGVQCSPITSAPSSRTNLFSAAPILSVSHHHQHHLPSPPVINQQRVLNVKVTTEKVSSSLTKVTCRSSMIQNGEQKQVCQDTSTDIVDMDLDSPYSPGSSEGDDLFEPPPENVKASLAIRSSQQTQKNSKHNLPPTSTTHKSPSKSQDKFDSIFGLSPQRTKSTTKAARTNAKGHTKSAKTKGKHGKGGKKEITIKMDEDQLQILDELPSSAVELQVKDKFLKKLNRQERVVEEVKLSLKPYYTKKYINKEEYKEILRRSVPKICHNRSGEINPIKISTLVDAYVKKYRYVKKKSSVGSSKPKVTKTTMWS